MAENKHHLAIGEEAVRGVAESAVVGFIPIETPFLPKLEVGERVRADFRGEESVLGDREYERMSRKWEGSLITRLAAEAGTQKGIVGTLLKHLFGKVTSAQNGATGQYRHFFQPTQIPFDAANLGTKGLTFNAGINEGANYKRFPYSGGRVKSLSLDASPGEYIKATFELMGQKQESTEANDDTIVFAAENLFLRYNHLVLYTGTITRTGTPPNYTQFAFGSATVIKPDKLTLKIENGFEDNLRLGGVDYPDKTRQGVIKANLQLTIDWEDPSTGFSSADEFEAWLAASGQTNFFVQLDTGVQAGTGDNYSLGFDIPAMERKGGMPEYTRDKDPMITLEYDALYDATTTLYAIAAMLKNTASAV